MSSTLYHQVDNFVRLLFIDLRLNQDTQKEIMKLKWQVSICLMAAGFLAAVSAAGETG